jgi:hypothetical protein
VKNAVGHVQAALMIAILVPVVTSLEYSQIILVFVVRVIGKIQKHSNVPNVTILAEHVIRISMDIQET